MVHPSTSASSDSQPYGRGFLPGCDLPRSLSSVLSSEKRWESKEDRNEELESREEGTVSV
jgi:hypothetical protein